MRMLTTAVAWGAAALTVGGAAPGAAQPLGTFRWQLAPHCNVVTLFVEQKGAVYELTGTDDQCNGPVAAAVKGTAHINPNGSAGMALLTTRPDGLTIVTTATLALANLSGSWIDEYGNGGAFTFNPAGAAGQPRRITLRGDFSLMYPATGAASFGSTAIWFGRTLASPPLIPTANFVPFGSTTPNCPGSGTNPTAVPGHLCVYTVVRNNIALMYAFNAGSGQQNIANTTGVSITVQSAAAGFAGAYGRWALTVP